MKDLASNFIYSEGGDKVYVKSSKLVAYTLTALARFPLSNLDSNIRVLSSSDSSSTAQGKHPLLLPPTRERTNYQINERSNIYS